MTTPDPTAEIRDVLGAHAKLVVDAATIDAHDDLFRCGMSSHASVTVMLALEDAFDIEFPDEMLTREVFQSVSSLTAAIARLRAG